MTKQQLPFIHLLNATIWDKEDYLDFCDKVVPVAAFPNLQEAFVRTTREILQAQGSYDTVVQVAQKTQRAMRTVVRILQQDTTFTSTDRRKMSHCLRYLRKWEIKAERAVFYELPLDDPQPKKVNRLDPQNPGKYTGIYRAVRSFLACVTDEKRVKRLKRCAWEQCGQWFYDTTHNLTKKTCSYRCYRRAIEKRRHSEKIEKQRQRRKEQRRQKVKAIFRS